MISGSGGRRKFVVFPLLFFSIALLYFSQNPLVLDPASGGIVNTHEHFQSLAEAAKYLEAARQNGIVRTVILGSPEATLLKEREGFFGERKYNLEVLKMGRAWPERFIVFPTVNPEDPRKLEKLKRYLAEGASGLKLYSGHTFFLQAAPRPPFHAAGLPIL